MRYYYNYGYDYSEENGIQGRSLYVHAPLSMEECEGHEPKIPMLNIILRKSGRMSLHRE